MKSVVVNYCNPFGKHLGRSEIDRYSGISFGSLHIANFFATDVLSIIACVTNITHKEYKFVVNS